MSGMPTLTDTGQRLYNALGPLAQHDADNGYALANYCAALAKPLDPVASLVRDGADGTPGWAPIFEVPTVDPKWLPWIAQIVGANISGLTTAQQRSLIQNPTGYERGSVARMTAMAQTTLTGTQTVQVSERYGNNAWVISFATIASETPSWQATLQAILSVKPAGLIVNYTIVVSGTYGVLPIAHSTYTAQWAAHPTYADIPLNPNH